jgi:hypothetical protein
MKYRSFDMPWGERVDTIRHALDVGFVGLYDESYHFYKEALAISSSFYCDGARTLYNI